MQENHKEAGILRWSLIWEESWSNQEKLGHAGEAHNMRFTTQPLNFQEQLQSVSQILTFQTVSPSSALYCKSFPASDLWLLQESDEKTEFNLAIFFFFYPRTYWICAKDGLGGDVSTCQWQTTLSSTFFFRDSSFIWEGCDMAKSQCSAGDQWIDSHQIMAQLCFQSTAGWDTQVYCLLLCNFFSSISCSILPFQRSINSTHTSTLIPSSHPGQRRIQCLIKMHPFSSLFQLKQTSAM